MVTGMKRAEVLALRWCDVDLASAILTVKQNHVRARGKTYDKDTKTHQERRVSLDAATVDVLRKHHARYDADTDMLGLELSDDAYLFSHQTTKSRPYNPDAVSHRYSDMCANVGIDTHIHALRHYSATERIQAGVDLCTVVGRLGHGGGGATTSRVYAAWVRESDRRAAEILGGRMQRPTLGGDS